MVINSEKIDELVTKILTFGHERGWRPVAGDLAKSIVLEGAELLEHFQWDGSSSRLSTDYSAKDMKEVKNEVADVFWYLIEFCDEMGIDLTEAVETKYKHNAEKYPVEKFAGKHNDEFYRSQKAKYRAEKK